MKIRVKHRNKEEKFISILDLKSELAKVISTKTLDLNEIEMKLNRGDILGFNDTEFKKVVEGGQ